MNEPFYDHLARKSIEGKSNIWIVNRIKINNIHRKTRKYMRDARTACEVGVGEGYLLRLLHSSGVKVVGIDISGYLVNKLKNDFNRDRLNIELIHGDISEFKVERDKFDLIYCLDILEHIQNIEKAIKNIKEMLVNGGLLIGTLPFRENLFENMVMCPKCRYEFHRFGHHHSFEKIEEIKELLGSEFEILDIGEVNIFQNLRDILRSIIAKISRLIFREKFSSTIYFVAKLKKVNHDS